MNALLSDRTFKRLALTPVQSIYDLKCDLFQWQLSLAIFHATLISWFFFFVFFFSNFKFFTKLIWPEVLCPQPLVNFLTLSSVMFVYDGNL